MTEQMHRWVMIIFISMVIILTGAVFLVGLNGEKSDASEKKIMQKMQHRKIVD